MEEKISADIVKDKTNPIRVFGYICKKKLLFNCLKCNTLLTTNAIVDKVIRLKTGRISFILNDNNADIFNKFKMNVIIENKLEVNINPDFNNVGINKVLCKNCNYHLGIKIKQADESQFFMVNKIILKENAMQYFSIEDIGITPFCFQYNKEEVKELDHEYFELENYINNSVNRILGFFDLLDEQKSEINTNKKRLEDIQKLSDILTYLVNKNYI